MLISVSYFALLREERGLEREEIDISANTVEELFHLLKERYNFSLRQELLRAAVNEEYVPWSYSLQEGDEVVFIPPVAGG